VQNAAANKAPASSGKKTLRSLRGWHDLCEQLGESRPEVASFLTPAKAYEGEDGTVRICFPNPFLLSMTERADIRDALRARLAPLLGRNLSDAQLVYETAEETEKSFSVLDEILDASENF
jgi:hypothetical protein